MKPPPTPRCLVTGLLAALMFLSPLSLRPDSPEWKFSDGTTLKGNISNVLEPMVVLTEGRSRAVIEMKYFDNEGLNRIADWIIAQRNTNALWKDSSSEMTRAIKDDLVIAKDGKLVEFDMAGRPEPEVYLVYFSAGWCSFCKKFTPDLLKTYNEFKADPAIAPLFEVILVSQDKSAKGQEDYMLGIPMPWPALRFSKFGHKKLINSLSGRKIPCLAVVDRNGTILYHSYRGSEYLEAGPPFESAKTLIKQMAQYKAISPENHPFAVRIHIRSHQKGSTPCLPYMTKLDQNRYQTLEVRRFNATVKVSAEGTVINVSTDQELGAIYARKFSRDASSWLFLPAINDGKPCEGTITIPVEL